MPGQQPPGILHPEAPLDRAFRQVAELGDHGEQQRKNSDRAELRPKPGRDRNQHAPGYAEAETADGPRPGLARRDARRQLRAAEQPADEVGADVAAAHQHHQEQHQRQPARPQPQRREAHDRHAEIDHAGKREPAPARPPTRHLPPFEPEPDPARDQQGQPGKTAEP